jgi:hypothetical protein
VLLSKISNTFISSIHFATYSLINLMNLLYPAASLQSRGFL